MVLKDDTWTKVLFLVSSTQSTERNVLFSKDKKFNDSRENTVKSLLIRELVTLSD